MEVVRENSHLRSRKKFWLVLCHFGAVLVKKRLFAVRMWLWVKGNELIGIEDHNEEEQIRIESAAVAKIRLAIRRGKDVRRMKGKANAA